jgi:hypothetical protein
MKWTLKKLRGSSGRLFRKSVSMDVLLQIRMMSCHWLSTHPVDLEVTSETGKNKAESL